MGESKIGGKKSETRKRIQKGDGRRPKRRRRKQREVKREKSKRDQGRGGQTVGGKGRREAREGSGRVQRSTF